MHVRSWCGPVRERLCGYRCFGSIDTLNNHFAGSGLRPKYLIADCDTHHKFPGDDIYPNSSSRQRAW